MGDEVQDEPVVEQVSAPAATEETPVVEEQTKNEPDAAGSVEAPKEEEAKEAAKVEEPKVEEAKTEETKTEEAKADEPVLEAPENDDAEAPKIVVEPETQETKGEEEAKSDEPKGDEEAKVDEEEPAPRIRVSGLKLLTNRMSVLTEWIFREVHFVKSEGQTFGMDVVDNGDGLLVTQVLPGGLVSAEATIREGDRILELNGQSMSGLKDDEMIRLLRDAMGEVTMRVACRVQGEGTYRGKAPPVGTEYIIQTVTIVPDDDGFGLDIAPVEGVTQVTGVVRGGAADKAGSLRVGDTILAINDFSLTGIAHDVVTQKFREAKGGPVKLAISGRNAGHPKHKRNSLFFSPETTGDVHQGTAVSPTEPAAKGKGCVIF